MRLGTTTPPWCGGTNLRFVSGFTMVELVVTMVIVGILAAVVMPKFSAQNDTDFAGYAHQLRAVFRYTQKVAVAQRRQTIVGYSQTAATICSEPRSASPSCPATFAEVDCTVSGRSPVDLPGGAIRSGPTNVSASGVVCFNARGEAYGGPLAINLDGAGAAEITIVAETGYVN